MDLKNFQGVPDGLAIDAEGGVWVAFWEGSAIRRFDGVDGSLTKEIRFAASRITSCAFGGAALNQLFVTSARDDDPNNENPEAGMTFMVDPGVSGLPVPAFAS